MENIMNTKWINAHSVQAMFACTRLNTPRSLKITGWDKWRCTNPAGCEIFQRHVNYSGFRL